MSSHPSSPKPGRWVRVYMTFSPPQPGATVIPPAAPPNVTVLMPVVALPNEFTIGGHYTKVL
jgi:hypothetical protein